MILSSFSKADIPLPIGMDQTGYIARFGGSVGIHDRPEIKVLLLKEGLDNTFCFVFCDLLGFSPARSALYEKRIATLLGTKEEHVVLTCTHTHSAPASMSLLLLGECRDSWFSKLEEVLLSCVRTARDCGYTPTRISFGKCSVNGVSRNRVKKNETDVDTDETLLFLESSKEKIALINYACHPVTKNADNRLYSRDYPFVVEETLRDSGVCDEVIFATAPCGDLNPVLQDEPGEYIRMKEYGEKIAEGAKKLIRENALIELSDLSCEKRTVTLPLFPDHPRRDTEFVARRACERYRATDNAQDKKYHEANHLWALTHARLQELGLREETFEARITHIKLGEFSIIGVPFELFSDIGIRLKEAFAPACVWELCGGNFGYFPSDELWDMAEYERGDAYMYYNRGGPLDKGSERRLFEALGK